MSHDLGPDRASPLPWFWNILARAEGDRERLRPQLEPLNRGALVRFLWTWEYARAELCSDEIRQALAADASDDTLADLADWILSQGEELYRAVLDRPAEARRKIELPRSSPGFLSEAYQLYRSRYSKDPPAPPD